MQKIFLLNYAKNMTKDSICSFVKKNNLNVSDKDIDVIFKHIKSYYNVFFDNPIYYIEMLKDKISYTSYCEILLLFDKYKHYLN